jgi:hypothetical protein
MLKGITQANRARTEATGRLEKVVEKMKKRMDQENSR